MVRMPGSIRAHKVLLRRSLARSDRIPLPPSTVVSPKTLDRNGCNHNPGPLNTDRNLQIQNINAVLMMPGLPVRITTVIPYTLDVPNRTVR